MTILQLIQLEWTKFRHNTVIRLLMVFFLIFFPACLYFGKFLKNIEGYVPFEINMFEFPYIWNYLGYAGNWIVFFFLGVLIIYTVTIEISNKTMRQAIIMGMSRLEFFKAKLLNVLVLSIFATLMYVALVVAFGLLNTNGFVLSDLMGNELAIPRFFLMSMGYMCFALFLALLFRKAGIAVFFYLSYIIIIEPLIKIWTQNNIISNKYINYFPMNTVEDLMPSPIFKFTEKLPNNLDYEILLSYNEAIILTVFYSLIFIALSYYSLQRRDM